MHDCISPNKVAMRTLQVLHPAVLGIGCFSHTLNHVGEKFNASNVNDFTTYWVSLVLRHELYGNSKQVVQLVASVLLAGGASGR